MTQCFENFAIRHTNFFFNLRKSAFYSFFFSPHKKREQKSCSQVSHCCMILPVWFYNLVGRETKQQTSLCKHSHLFILVFFLICKNFLVFNSKKRAANRSDLGRVNGFYYTIIIHYQIAKISSSMQYSNTGTEIL